MGPPALSGGVNGQVYAAVVVGDTVYVGGNFSLAQARGQASTSRDNLAAFDLNTGALRRSWRADVSGTVRDELGSIGVGYAVIEVAGLRLVQRLASDAVLARAFGVVEGTYWLTTGLGSLLAPVLVALFGLRGALLAVGIVLPLLMLARYRSLLRLEASAPVPEPEYTLLRRVGMFAPLPVVRIEELARRVEHVRAGAAVTPPA